MPLMDDLAFLPELSRRSHSVVPVMPACAVAVLSTLQAPCEASAGLLTGVACNLELTCMRYNQIHEGF